MHSTFIDTNGVRLHAMHAGSADRPLVILLHGFPEFWFGWNEYIEPIARAGFRVLAPDQRGYNLSAKPRYIASYRLDTLAKDVVGLIDSAGARRAHIVGHDWGAVATWWLGIQHPDRVDKLVAINAPHLKIMRKHLSRIRGR